jgi:hypothetical protein
MDDLAIYRRPVARTRQQAGQLDPAVELAQGTRAPSGPGVEGHSC